MIYKTFEEWKAGHWLEDGEPRTEAYTEDELLLIEMGWKYGFDACKEQTKPLSDEEMIKTINSYATGWFSDKFEKGVFITEEAMIKFARAIEERHGIK